MTTAKEDPPDKGAGMSWNRIEGAKEKDKEQHKQWAVASNYLSALNSSKYSNPPVQDWAYKRQIIKAQLQLGESNRSAKYKKAIVMILHNGILADKSSTQLW